MTEGSIGKKIIFFSIPLILGNLLQQLYSTADSIIVGNFVGSNALAAVGSSTALIGLLIAFSQGVSVGAGVVAAQYLGAKNRRDVQGSIPYSLRPGGSSGNYFNSRRNHLQPSASGMDEYAGGGFGGLGDLSSDLFWRPDF